MEEWHQKLHNNTSPDDVVICQVLNLFSVWIFFSFRMRFLNALILMLSLQALIDHIESDFDMGVYWKSLNDNGITKERLLSYDRGIHSEPSFRRNQRDGLLRDLRNYMRTLKVGFINLSLLRSIFLFFINVFCKTWKLHLVYIL